MRVGDASSKAPAKIHTLVPRWRRLTCADIRARILANADSLAACAKHYAGYGAAEAGRDYNAADMSERTFRQIYLPPFESAVKAGAATIMSAFNTLNEVPATANPMTLTKILREEWKFQGLVVSDWQAVAELIPHGVALDGATAARKAILAGLDVDMESGLFQRHLSELVRIGRRAGIGAG